VGGGIALEPTSGNLSTDFRITNCQFLGNRAKRSGGGAALGFGSTDGTITVTGSTFSDNISSNNTGGGIYFGQGTLYVTASTISNNKGAIINGTGPGGGGV
jgi:hypothetical protein